MFRQNEKISILGTAFNPLPLQLFEKNSYTGLFLSVGGDALLGPLIYLEFAASEVVPACHHHFYPADYFVRFPVRTHLFAGQT